MPYVPSWWLVVAALGRTPVPLPHTINTPAAKGNWHRQTIIFSILYSHMQKQDEEFHCFAPLVTACNCSIESNKRERKRELILVCWVMAMCRLGDCVIGSWRLQATCPNIEGENTSSLLRSVGYNNPFTRRHIPEERNLQPHRFENLWTGKGRRRILSCWRHVGCSEYPQDGCRRVSEMFVSSWQSVRCHFPEGSKLRNHLIGIWITSDETTCFCVWNITEWTGLEVWDQDLCSANMSAKR